MGNRITGIYIYNNKADLFNIKLQSSDKLIIRGIFSEKVKQSILNVVRLLNLYNNLCIEIDSKKIIDGDSIALPVYILLHSYLNKIKIDNLTATGAIDINGNVKAVGNINKKVQCARDNGLNIIIPEENRKDLICEYSGIIYLKKINSNKG